MVVVVALVCTLWLSSVYLLATRLSVEGTFRVEWKPVRPRSVPRPAQSVTVTPHPVPVTPGPVTPAGPEVTVTEEEPLRLDGAGGSSTAELFGGLPLAPGAWVATYPPGTAKE